VRTSAARFPALVSSAVALLLMFASTGLSAQTSGSVLELIESSGELSVGSEVSGALSSSDTRAPDDSYLEVWTIEGRPGETVTIDLLADDFDPFLYVTGPGFEETLTDDDSGGACHARITMTYLEGGTFRVAAGSNLPRSTGTYLLRVSDTPGPTAGYPCGGMNPAVLLDLPTDGRSLVLGDVVNGSLTGGSPSIGREGKKAEAWVLQGVAGETVTVTLESEAFDCYLYIAGPGLGEVLTDDDSAGDLDSQLTISFPEDGTYVVVASSLGAGSTGPYTIRVEEPTDLREMPTNGRTLSLGETGNGYLTSNDQFIEQGRRGQAWALEGVQGETYTIDFRSEDFDCYLYLIGPGLSEPITDDDGAGNLDSRITFTFPQNGTYLVIATTLGGVGEGPYTITVEKSVGMHELPTDGRELSVGEVFDGWLSESDPVIASGRHGQAWVLEARSGDTYTIDMMSDEFDSYLYVVGPGMLDPRSNDDGGEGRNARLTVTASEAGVFRVIASSLTPSSMGSYSLRVSSRGR